MIRSHWTSKPFKYNPVHVYRIPFGSENYFKPRGLWYDVDGDWARFCEGDSWNLAGLKHRYQIEIETKDIWIISSEKDFLAFYNMFKSSGHPGLSIFSGRDSIAWNRVLSFAKGIEIAPYLWSCRLKYSWYYGWDCASGVIWDLSAITSFKEIPTEVPKYEELSSNDSGSTGEGAH